jgi:hypothetical protein
MKIVGRRARFGQSQNRSQNVSANVRGYYVRLNSIGRVFRSCDGLFAATFATSLGNLARAFCSAYHTIDCGFV